jgi:DNA-binding response OmpR family regulator
MILIVDDNEDVRSLLAVLLANEGYDVVEAIDGQAALDVTADRQIDLIVLDLTMPRLDGVPFCRTYRERGGQAPVILVTAVQGEELAAAISSCGAIGSIQKPFQIEDALALIEKHAGRPR